MSALSPLAPAGASPFGVPVAEKLGKNNYMLWKAQVLPAMRGAQMYGYLDGTSVAPSREIDVKEADKIIKASNPEYGRWVVMDQQVLGYLMSSGVSLDDGTTMEVSRGDVLFKALCTGNQHPNCTLHHKNR